MELTEEQRKIFESVDVKFLDDNVSKRYGEACFTAGLAEGIREPMEVLRELVARLDFIHADEKYKSVWMINQLHTAPYDGPIYTAELDAARLFCARYPK